MLKDQESVRIRNPDGFISDSNPHQVHIMDGTTKANVNTVNELKTADSGLETAMGNNTGRSLRGVAADKAVTTAESVISPNLTGRYKFPTSAAQMSIVSTSTQDTYATGTGAWAVLVRGLTEDETSNWIDDSELVALNGTNIVTTTKEFIRVNSLIVVAVGSAAANVGVITMTNGADTLHSMVAGDNLTRTAIWSTATDIPAYARNMRLITGKSSQNSTFNVYVRPSTLPFVKAFKFTGFEGVTEIYFDVPYELPGKTDIEITSNSDGGTVDVAMYFEITLVDTSV